MLGAFPLPIVHFQATTRLSLFRLTKKPTGCANFSLHIGRSGIFFIALYITFYLGTMLAVCRVILSLVLPTINSY